MAFLILFFVLFFLRRGLSGYSSANGRSFLRLSSFFIFRVRIASVDRSRQLISVQSGWRTESDGFKLLKIN